MLNRSLHTGSSESTLIKMPHCRKSHVAGHFLKYCSMYNYADDSTLSYCHKILDILKSVLQQESIILLDWFGTNQMQTNPTHCRGEYHM